MYAFMIDISWWGGQARPRVLEREGDACRLILQHFFRSTDTVYKTVINAFCHSFIGGISGYIRVYNASTVDIHTFIIVLRSGRQARPRVLEREGHARRLLVDNSFIDCIRRYVRVYNSISRYIRVYNSRSRCIRVYNSIGKYARVYDRHILMRGAGSTTRARKWRPRLPPARAPLLIQIIMIVITQFRVSGFGFRVSGSEFRISWFGFQVGGQSPDQRHTRQQVVVNAVSRYKFTTPRYKNLSMFAHGTRDQEPETKTRNRVVTPKPETRWGSRNLIPHTLSLNSFCRRQLPHKSVDSSLTITYYYSYRE